MGLSSIARIGEQIATEILLFIGGLAAIGGLLGNIQSFLSLSLYYVGGAAVVTLVVLKGGPAIRSALNHGDDQSLVSTPSESDAGVPSLELYQSEGCPYCQTVRRFCTRNGLSLIIHNPRTAGAFFTSGRVRNKQRHDELIAHGKDQIPLLVDTERDEVLYESDDIIAYLKTNYI